MDVHARTPRSLFDSMVCYEVPPFQRPYVWNEDDQWQPLWDDIAHLVEQIERAPEHDPQRTLNHFLGAVVLKQRLQPQGSAERRSIIDGQQRLTTLQLVLSAARAVMDELKADESEEIQELTYNRAVRFRGLPDRFKLWPSRKDRDAYSAVLEGVADADGPHGGSKIIEAHDFFQREIAKWAKEPDADPDRHFRLSLLSDVLQFRLQVVSINLDPADDEQLIFEALNDRGTSLLAADLIKNFIFQACEQVSGDVDRWCDDYWGDFDDEWWRGEISQGRQFKSRIDLFLHYWLTMRKKEEIPTEKVFDRFKAYSSAFLRSADSAEAFLRNLRADAHAFRELVAQKDDSPAARFYGRIVEDLELGTFIPLLLLVISNTQPIPQDQVRAALDSVESMVVRRSLLRLTTKDLNSLVVAMLKDVDGSPPEAFGRMVTSYLLRQTAEARKWPTDAEVEADLPLAKLYGNVKQSRLRVVLTAIELHLREDARITYVALPERLEIEHIMPQGWRSHWKLVDDSEPNADETRDHAINTLGNLTLVTKKLNKALSNRPWLDIDAEGLGSGELAGLGKQSILRKFSGLRISHDLEDPAQTRWDEMDIVARSLELTEHVLAVWPRPVDEE